MDNHFRICLWRNFGAAIQMLNNFVVMCPDELWRNDKKFFYMTYHTVIFLDYYLTIPVRDFKPGLPYSIVDSDKLPEGAVDDVIPDHFYTKRDFISYLSGIEQKCKSLIVYSPIEKFEQIWIDKEEIDLHGLCPDILTNYTVLEIIFYNLRHVQHHLGQLNFMLRQKANKAVDWISLIDKE